MIEATKQEIGIALRILLEQKKAIEEFAKTIFPHHITSAIPDFHSEIYDLLLDENIKRVCIAAPRGFSKSTIVSFIYVLWQALYKKSKFIVIISDTYTQSKFFLEAIKKEIEDNAMIGLMFGNMKGEQWSEGEIEFNNGVKIVCKGSGMKIRGLKYRETRPDLIILDDLENMELVESKERRDKMLRWFSAEVMPAIDINGRIIYVGTILHYDSLLNKVLNDKSWKRKIYRAMDKEHTVSLWPQRFSVDKLNGIKQEYRNNGVLDLFYSEYMNDPISNENAEFKKEDFQYFEMSDIDHRKLNKFTTVDLAISKKESADYTVILTVGIDENNNMFILDIQRERLDPLQTIKRIFWVNTKFRPIWIGIESVAYQKALIYFLKDEMKKKHQYLNIKEIKPDTDKERRIRRIIPRYKSGTIFHQTKHTNLEEELLRFPKGQHDDIADCVAMQIEMNFPYQKKEPKELVKNESLLSKKDPYFEIARKNEYEEKESYLDI